MALTKEKRTYSISKFFTTVQCTTNLCVRLSEFSDCNLAEKSKFELLTWDRQTVLWQEEGGGVSSESKERRGRRRGNGAEAAERIVLSSV